MNFFLWPRNDIEKIECLVFSRWKGDDQDKFKPLQVYAYSFFPRIRPPLSKKSFPVSRMGKKKASWEVGNLFFFPNSFFLN